MIGYASWGSNDNNRHHAFSGFHWLPGAIVTEFVSTNARTFKKPAGSLESQPDWDHAQPVVRRQSANHDGGLSSGRRHRRIGTRR